ncbi:hypothetical protein [Natronococcus wangiae]|uniref:hypothetical protein n=1 Tax=Natronococcus wangiae TaxID=3068275 RepID=UPI00273E00BD|nr:hypothetical protein [Natronococcus sp. AD5]
MALADDSRPPLPEWITDAYTVILAHITDSETIDTHGRIPAISREQAVDVLSTSDELALEPADAEHAITRLIKRGYLYEVDAELRVTVPSEDW